MVDALVLGTSDFGRGSSSLPVGIMKKTIDTLDIPIDLVRRGASPRWVSVVIAQVTCEGSDEL